MLVANLSMLGPQPTGLGVYAQQCARALADRFEISVVAGHGFVPNAPVIATAPMSVAIGSGRGAAIKRLIWTNLLRLPSNALVYSPTHHPLPRATRQIVTVHDLICLRFPRQHRTQYFYFRFILPHILKRCTAVFTVSETTKLDVANFYKLPLERIFVVPNGVDAKKFSSQLGIHADKKADPFLLMVGARYPHKNVQEVLEQSKYWARDYRLVIVSCVGKYREKLLEQAQQLGLSDRLQFMDYVDRQELLGLYRSCSALLYPSLWEGFGIPPLEALASGTQVVASDIAVHREVLGEAAIFVSLGEPESWRRAFSTLSDRDECIGRSLAATKVLEKFTWDHAADALQSALLAVDSGLPLRIKVGQAAVASGT